MTAPGLDFLVAEAADQGARSYQEDSTRVWSSTTNGAANGVVLAVLSDGMGGHVSGEVASRIASTRYVEIVRSGSSSGDPIERLLERALILSNDAIGESVRRDNALKGMGCTLIAAHFSSEGLRWTSVGDSSLLLYRDSQLLRLNEDHSLGALLDKQAAAKIISFEEARNDPRRRVLRSALVGQPLAVKEVRVAPLPLRHDDWVIVASDGLETLNGDEISSILHEYCDAAGHPKDVVEHLLQAVRSKRLENQDNTSVIVARVCDPTQVDTKILEPRTPTIRKMVELTTDPVRPALPLLKPRAVASSRAAALAQGAVAPSLDHEADGRTERVIRPIGEPEPTMPVTERLLEPSMSAGPMLPPRANRDEEGGGALVWIAASAILALITAILIVIVWPTLGQDAADKSKPGTEASQPAPPGAPATSSSPPATPPAAEKSTGPSPAPPAPAPPAPASATTKQELSPNRRPQN